MRILILGAGAIGGYYGLQLAQAGADVRFLVRPGRAAQLERDGLMVWTQGEVRRQRVQTLQAGRIDQPFDAIILTCKAYDLASAIEAVAPAVGPASVVVPLLNGLAHLDALDARFGAARVLGGVAYIASTLEPDGTIRHTSPMDTLLFGDRSGRLTPPVEALAAAFAATPVAARASTDIVQDLWEKWSMLAAGAAITCLLRGTIGEVLATEDGGRVAATLVAETRAIAAGFGHAPRPAAIAQADRTLGDPQSRWAASMMRDIQQGAPRLEAEHVIGDLIRRGRQVKVAVPLLEAAYAQLQVYNARGTGASGMITLHQASIPPCLRALASLAHVLAKGEAHCQAGSIDPAALLHARLHADMFPLVRQVQIACDTAIRLGARLVGLAPPSTPDTEASFAELQHRIAQAVAFLAALRPEQFEDSEGETSIMAGIPYRTALIVGAGAGISASLARALAAAGLKVGLAARDTAKLAPLLAETGARAFAADAADPAGVARLFDVVDAELGEPDVVVYNASARAHGPIAEIDPAAVLRATSITAFGAFLVTQQAARRMLPRGRGAILLTGATAGVKGFALSSAFAMGKFGLRGLAQSAARELGPQGIHVAHVVIDGAVRSARRPDAADRPDGTLSPDGIAQTYLDVLRQPRDAWSLEVELRPWLERF